MAQVTTSGSGEMLSDNLFDFDVAKTTTDKLEDIIRGWAEPWRIRNIEFLGGRDWLVIAEMEWESLEAKCDAYGQNIEDWR